MITTVLLSATLGHGQSVNSVPIEPDRLAVAEQPETMLSGGDAVEIGGGTVKKIPLSQTPAQLRKALGPDVLSSYQ